MKIKQFGIKFGDNDYYNTFATLLPVIAEHVFYRQELDNRFTPELTRQILLDVINVNTYGFYIIGQNMYRYSTNISKEFLIDYLTIKDSQLLIDDEITQHLDDCKGWNNSETFCVTVEETPYFWTI